MGAVQDWITLELAIRIRNDKSNSDISDAAKRRLRKTSGALFVIITVFFIAFTVTVIVLAHKEGNEGIPFSLKRCS